MNNLPEIRPQDVKLGWRLCNHVVLRKINTVEAYEHVFAAYREGLPVVATIGKVIKRKPDLCTLGCYTFPVQLVTHPDVFPTPLPYPNYIADSEWGRNIRHPDLPMLRSHYKWVPYDLSVVMATRVQVLREVGNDKGIEAPTPQHYDQVRVRLASRTGMSLTGMMDTSPIQYSIRLLQVVEAVQLKIQEEFFKGGPIE